MKNTWMMLLVQSIPFWAMFAMTFTGVVALWVLLLPIDWYNLGVGVIATLGVAAIFTFVPNLYEKLLGKPMGLINPIKMPNAIIFLAIVCACMGVIVIVGTTIMRKKARKNA